VQALHSAVEANAIVVNTRGNEASPCQLQQHRRELLSYAGIAVESLASTRGILRVLCGVGNLFLITRDRSAFCKK
jgi:hypothetical protein